MQYKILVVEDDPVTMKLLKGILLKQEYVVGEAVDGREGLELAKSFKPDLILLDVMLPEIDGFEVCRRVREDPAVSRTPIMMLTTLSSVEQKIKGFEAGADDYMGKPFEPGELIARVAAMLRRSKLVITRDVRDLHGKIIAVFSLRGGAGVSSVAANVAAGLTKTWDEETVLVDMNRVVGQSALFFNVSLKNTWSDIAGVPPEEIDPDLLEMILMEHASGVKILASPRSPEEGELLGAETVAHVLDLLRKNYHYVVLDMPHDFSETSLAALDMADEILLLFPPEIAGVRSAMIALQTFYSLDFRSNVVKTIVNWTFAEYGVAQEKIEAAIKRPVDLVIPYAPKYFLPALSYGVPIVLKEPESPIGALFEDLSFAISKEEHNQEIPKNPTDTWKRIARRIKKRREKIEQGVPL